jgi:hypothetical protein
MGFTPDVPIEYDAVDGSLLVAAEDVAGPARITIERIVLERLVKSPCPDKDSRSIANRN